MIRAFLLLSLFGAALSAQTTVTVPNIPSATGLDRPFPGGPGRYQQWYSAASVQAGITQPMRFEKLELFAGPTPNSTTATIDCEVWLGHGQGFGVFSAFDSNWSSPPVQVKTRGNVTLNAAAQGQVCMTFPFTTQFTWDHTRPLLVEFRIYGNSLGSGVFNYNFNGTTQALGGTMRVYGTTGGAGATTGTVQQGWGLFTRFTARPGVNLGYGAGCPGEGNFTPTHTVTNLAWPGITWNHQLAGAASQRPAFWVIGDTKDAPYPVDLGAIIFGFQTNCLLHTNPVNAVGVVTVGGGPGAGVASLGVFLPAVTSYIGTSLFTQWVVFDPLAPSTVLAVTPAVWSIVAPVGG